MIFLCLKSFFKNQLSKICVYFSLRSSCNCCIFKITSLATIYIFQTKVKGTRIRLSLVIAVFRISFYIFLFKIIIINIAFEKISNLYRTLTLKKKRYWEYLMQWFFKFDFILIFYQLYCNKKWYLSWKNGEKESFGENRFFQLSSL